MIASGDKGAVQKFFEPIFVTLATNYKEFLADVEQRELVIGAMEERLDAAKKAFERESSDVARAAIGKGDPATDWKIVPTEHADMFADEAPPLARVLRGGRSTGLAQKYEDLNDKAVKARDNFKSTVRRANTAVFSTASLAALLLVAGGLQELLVQLQGIYFAMA